MLRRHCELVLDWNRSVSNLISRNDESRIVERHVRESLEPASWLAGLGAARWVDLGAGAGFPALPLCIAGVGERWTLVESRRPKALFLRKAVEDLGLRGKIQIEHGRIEDLKASLRPVDGFTSRATYKLGPTLRLAADCLAPGGSAVLWKGVAWKPELDDLPQWESSWTLDRELDIADGKSVVVHFIRK